MSALDKTFSTLRAGAALHGVELRTIRADTESWGFLAVAAVHEEFPTLSGVEAWLRQLHESDPARTAGGSE